MNKYEKWYNAIIKRGKENLRDGYLETHHIIPRCIGGNDDLGNLVKLTPEEHYICHQLLLKIYPNHSSLVFAASMMTVNDIRVNKRTQNKIFGWLRKRMSISMSEIQKGRVNIKKDGKSIRIRKEELESYLENGWSLGVVRDYEKWREKISKSRVANFKKNKLDPYFKNPDYCCICGTVLPYLCKGKRKRRMKNSSYSPNCGSKKCRSEKAKINAIKIKEKRGPVEPRKCQTCGRETTNPKFCSLKCFNKRLSPILR